jgi:hypothetical protein
MKTVVLDVETIADTAAMARAGYVSAEGEFAPWPLHELACASVLIVRKLGLNEPTFDLRSFSRGEMSERAIIASVERIIEDAQLIITYNGQALDLPVLVARAILNDESIPTLARLNDRCRPGLHYDLHQQVKGTGAGIKLAHLCAAFGIPAKMGANGESVAGLVAAGNWAGIEHYCETDVLATWLAVQMWESRDLPGHGLEQWRLLDRWMARFPIANPLLGEFRNALSAHEEWRGGQRLGSPKEFAQPRSDSDGGHGPVRGSRDHAARFRPTFDDIVF